MNTEHDEVVVLDVSDEALELAAVGAQVGKPTSTSLTTCGCYGC